MTTLTIELTDEKALGLLQDMEALHLIRVVKEPFKISSLRDKIQTPMNADAIDKQLDRLRGEWRRDI